MTTSASTTLTRSSASSAGPVGTSPARIHSISAGSISTTAHFSTRQVRQHLVHRVAEAEPADHDGARLVDQRQRRVRHGPLGAHLDGVHHEDAVDPELERDRAAVDRAPLAQHQLAALALGARDLDVLDLGGWGQHPPILASHLDVTRSR